MNPLGVDRPTLPEFFTQKDIGLAQEPFEVCVREIFRGAGVCIERGYSNVIPGVITVGECSTTSSGIAGATVMGHIAGMKRCPFRSLTAKFETAYF